MSDLTRAEIAALTGLPPSTLTRELARFPEARTERGRYCRSHPGLAAWLASYLGGEAPVAPPADGAERNQEVRWLPSGFFVSWAEWDILRGGDEQAALGELARLIATSRLRPHLLVPDGLAFVPMTLPGGATVNRTQWQTLRNGGAMAAGYALDVLIRRWGQ